MEAVESDWLHFVGGEWAESADGSRIPVENPANGEKIAEVARAGAEDVGRAAEAARRCADRRVLSDMVPEERSRFLFSVAEELRAMEDDVARLECLDNGKPISAARHQAESSARYFEYYGGLADKLEGTSIPLGPDYVDYTRREPYGVSAHIVPWNYPLNLAARSVSCALAAGNAVVVKSPELSPLSVYLLGRACERAGLPEGAVNIVCGYGEEAGAPLVRHEDVDHVVFTGSVPTGREIMKMAAERIVPSIVELGGKSAGVVCKDADLDQVLDSTITGIFTNAGQICSACSRLLVHRSRYDEVLDALKVETQELTIGPGSEDHDVTPLISRDQLDRVVGMCRRAKSDGARVVTGGGPVADTPGHFMQPTIFADIDPDTELAREEVFGPVLAVMPFDDEAQAIRLANGTEFGLCAGVYTKDLERAHRMARRLVAGQVFVNEWFAGGVETPFGGMGKSGIGREKGREALMNYVQTKNVAIRLD